MRQRHHFVSKYPCILLALVLAVSLAAGTVYSQPFPGKGVPRALTKNHPRFRAAVEAQTKNLGKLMGIFGVVGSGIGADPQGEPEIRVFTARSGIQGIPAMLDGVAVREKVTGRFYALVDTTGRFERPVPLGVSTGHPAITAGTIGARVKDGAGNVYALSNNHVYAAVNSAKIGDPVLQPGAYDGGKVGSDPTIIDGDEIGTLYSYQPITMCRWIWQGMWYTCPTTNSVDAAIALSSTDLLGNSTPVDSDPDAYYTPSEETAEPFVGQAVKKIGRTTELTYGTVDAVNVTVDVCYDDTCSDIARFTDQISITPGTFSAGGDSGSLIVTQDGNHPVGLLFAGSNTITLANRISSVLSTFGVTIDSGTVEPFADVAVTSVDAPATVVQGSPANVDVTVQNLGNQDVTDPFTVTLRDEPDSTAIGVQEVSGLSAGMSTTLHFSWDTTGSRIGSHTLEASHNLSDDNAANNTATTATEVVASLVDVGVTGISVPASVEEGSNVQVSVTVKNLGTVLVGVFGVTLKDGATVIGTEQTTNGLAPGESETIPFQWNPSGIGDHELVASHDLGGDELSSNDTMSVAVKVSAPSMGPNLRFGKVWASTAYWTTVTLDHDYGTDMVVVCTPNYDSNPHGSVVTPVVVQVQNAYSDSFDVRLSPAVWTTFETSETWVYYMVVKRGVYNEAEHGVKMEAVKFLSTVTDRKRSWVGQNRAYGQSYTKPVVLGQVMTFSSGRWVTFWCRGSSSTNPPSASSLWVGKHMGADIRARANEIIGYVVIEAGSGSIEGNPYVANLGPDTIRGVGNNPPYTYALSGLSNPSIAVVSQAGMDDTDGGWAILFGDDPIRPGALNLAIDEDWAIDSERSHSTEQAGYIVFE
jgi:archaellum component FlaF (FlaF/FlaG flagellin family)